MTFDQILPQLKDGRSVARESWGSKIVDIYEFISGFGDISILVFIQTDAYGQMKVWTPTAEDILADDWRVADAQ